MGFWVGRPICRVSYPIRRGMHSISYSPCQCQACLLGAEVGDADKTGIFIGSSVTRSWPDVEVVVIPVLADSLEKKFFACARMPTNYGTTNFDREPCVSTAVTGPAGQRKLGCRSTHTCSPTSTDRTSCRRSFNFAELWSSWLHPPDVGDMALQPFAFIFHGEIRTSTLSYRRISCQYVQDFLENQTY